MTKIHVMISNFNTADRLRDTLLSISSQSSRDFTLSIADACSTDHSLLVIKEFSGLVSNLIVEPDSGLYDGLAKLFSLDLGPGIYCYINAGDIYMPYAFERILRVFSRLDCKWVTGLPTIRDREQAIIRVTRPLPYFGFLIRNGVHNGSLLPFIQQESTFWSYELHNRLKLDRLKAFKYAGDSYLWSVFSRHASLYVLDCSIAGFTLHGEHLSSSRRKYRTEYNAIHGNSSARFVALLFSVLLCIPYRIFSFPDSVFYRLPRVIRSLPE